MADVSGSRGIAVTKALGSVDVGQSLRPYPPAWWLRLLKRWKGTDAMLPSRCGALLDALEMSKPIGVLVKSVKPGQDRRADLPTIGPETIRLAADAGLAGVAYDAGGTILAERETCIARVLRRTWAILAWLRS